MSGDPERVLPPAVHGDPNDTRFVTEDLPRFWRAFEHLDDEDAEHVFEDTYLQPGTPGLQAFTSSRIGTAARLVSKVRACRVYYGGLRPSTTSIKAALPAIRTSFERLATLYEDAVFPDMTFVIGRLSSGGTVTDAGLLIGTEFFTRDAGTPVHELSAWERGVTRDVTALGFIVAHELIHAQQLVALGSAPAGEPTLLRQCLMEGAAEFLGRVISGGVPSEDLHMYGRTHEAALWARFSRERQGTSWDGWLYEGDRADGVPADLGYFVGARICEAYVARHHDHREAVRDMIVRALLDPEGFLMDSGYDGRVEWEDALDVQ